VKGLLEDCKHALRLYRRTPVSSAIAVVVLAVGMAFVGAFLSLYVDLLLKPHPGIEDSGQIVTVGQVDGARLNGLSIAMIERINDELASLESAVGVGSFGLGRSPENTFFQVEAVTQAFFEEIRPHLAIGRGFELADHDSEAELVAVISDRFWREEFGGTPDVVGLSIEIANPASQNDDEESGNGPTEFRIIGVMAPEMGGMNSDTIEFWAPFEQTASLVFGGSVQILRSFTLLTYGRLSPGASSASVARELEARFPVGTEEFPRLPGYRFDAIDGIVRDINVHRETARQLKLFLTGSILLALVAAANVSLFLLARAPGRRRELAIRMSVGAPVRRLARQLATEAGLLVVVSAALGLPVSTWLVNFLRGLAFLRQAQWSSVTLLDWRVLSLVGLFLLFLTLLTSLAPILGLKKLGIASSSRLVAARASLSQLIAGTAQIAIAGALGGAAIAFGWYLGSMTLGYPGYETEDRYMVQFSFFSSQSASTAAGGIIRPAPVDAVRNRETIEAIPGVRALSWTSLIPAAQPIINTRTMPDPNDPARQINIGYGNVDAAFTDLLGLKLLHGRALVKNETGVALVNQSLARRFFGRDNVVGESLEIPGAGSPRTGIVGVLEDLSFTHPAAAVGPMVFVQWPPSPFGPSAIVDSSLPAAELQQRLRDLIESGELELGQPSVRPLTDIRDNSIAPDKARSLLTIGTSSLVVLLAAFGFYGTQRFLVTAGRREYAIRASLGAGPISLGRLVLLRGLILSLPGLVTGALLAFIVVAWLRDGFVSTDVSPGIVTILVTGGLTLLLLAASLGPASRARRTQPAPLLREE
jgi:predicted permease